MKKLLTIIIPVYNKESYLTKCIESLINLQMEHSKIEAIFIDDCSTDNSVEIIDNYSKNYQFIKMIKLSNNTGSPSEPRNIGIKAAKGRYLTLLDADDWLDENGFPKFIEKVSSDDADFAIGQSVRHKNDAIVNQATFTSYKDVSNIKPEDIEHIFRSVGPPGKVFKREIILKNNIEFQNMKFGEDKLFFVELISKVNYVTMSTIPIYHVNRYDENISLVKETSVIEKGYLNQKITKMICEMDISLTLKKRALSRMVELDFFRRFFQTKTFIKSKNKEDFYRLFYEVENILEVHGFKLKDLIEIKIYKAMYEMYHQENNDKFVKFTKDIVYKNWRYYVDNGVMYKNLLNIYGVLHPIPIDCYPIYEGTQLIGDEMLEVVKVFKTQDTNITAVSIVEINNALNKHYIDFNYKGNKLYIKQSEFAKMNNVNINICIHYGEMGESLVYASYPSYNTEYRVKRQSFKLEFINRLSDKHKSKYITQITGPLVTLKKSHLYKDIEFMERLSSLDAGMKIVPKSIDYTLKGTPRLVLENGMVLTANKDFVKPLDTYNHYKYLTKAPNEINIKKICKLYDSRTFKSKPIRTLEIGEKIKIKKIIYTNNSTPRLVTEDNYYLTANKSYVEVIKE